MKKLAIYIKSSVSEFAETLTVDNTYILVDNTFITADETLYNGELITKDIYNRVELFNDETVSITSSVQNVNDISKVYTDYSQSFTIPASKHNNKIFKHWYESAIDYGYDARLKYEAYIELDTMPFRKGVIQLEKANIKNGVPDSYSINFVGVLGSLKDAFGGLKLSDLDYTQYNISYSYDTVSNLVSDNINSNVKFPLISSNRLWVYNTSNTDPDNIHKTSGAINYRELFPALRLNIIFDIIQQQLGVSFTSDFFTDKRWKQAFLYLKNTDTFTVQSGQTYVNFQYLSLANNIISLSSGSDLNVNNLDLNTSFFSANYSIGSTSSGNVNVSVYKNNILQETRNVILNANVPYTFTFIDSSSNINIGGKYNITVSNAGLTNVTFVSKINYTILGTNGVTQTGYIGGNSLSPFYNYSSSQSTFSSINLKNYIPDITIESFFSSILKMFNLTCIGSNNNTFELKNLEEWYKSGSIKDVSEYITTDEIEVSRMQTYSKVNFNYEKSESFLNKKYAASTLNKEYGDLVADFDIDGGTFEVKLPFENMLFQKFSDTTLLVGYALKNDYKGYTPKPMIIYDYGIIQNCDIHLSDDSNNKYNILTYNMFSQEIIGDDNETHSLNFGSEISPFTYNIINNSLYSDYHKNYIENIYNKKTRLLKLKSVLPNSIITNLKLNDRLVIRDKRYLINQFTSNLMTNEVSFELINDFRELETPIDCVVSDWSDWSNCINGNKTRTRTIITPAANGGISCPVLIETVSCTVTPVNCVVSDWSDWGECVGTTNNCYNYTLSPSFDTTYAWVNCLTGADMSQFLTAGQSLAICSRTNPTGGQYTKGTVCGTYLTYSQTRTRTIITPASDGGTACPVLFETQSCTP